MKPRKKPRLSRVAFDAKTTSLPTWSELGLVFGSKTLKGKTYKLPEGSEKDNYYLRHHTIYNPWLFYRDGYPAQPFRDSNGVLGDIPVELFMGNDGTIEYKDMNHARYVWMHYIGAYSDKRKRRGSFTSKQWKEYLNDEIDDEDWIPAKAHFARSTNGLPQHLRNMVKSLDEIVPLIDRPTSLGAWKIGKILADFVDLFPKCYFINLSDILNTLYGVRGMDTKSSWRSGLFKQSDEWAWMYNFYRLFGGDKIIGKPSLYYALTKEWWSNRVVTGTSGRLIYTLITINGGDEVIQWWEDKMKNVHQCRKISVANVLASERFVDKIESIAKAWRKTRIAKIHTPAMIEKQDEVWKTQAEKFRKELDSLKRGKRSKKVNV